MTAVARRIEALERRVQQNEADRNFLQATVNQQQAALDALASLPASGNGSGSPAASSTTVLGASKSFVVPAGFTHCVYVVTGTAGATCGGGGGTFIQVALRLKRNGTDVYPPNPTNPVQGALSVWIAASTANSVTSVFSEELGVTVAGGDTLAFEAWHLEPTPANVAGNVGVGINVLVLFLR